VIISDVSALVADLLSDSQDLPEPSSVEIRTNGWVTCRPIEMHMVNRAAVARWAQQVGVQMTIDPRQMFVETAAFFEVNNVQVKVWSSETHAGLFQTLSKHGLSLDDDQAMSVDPTIFLDGE